MKHLIHLISLVYGMSFSGFCSLYRGEVYSGSPVFSANSGKGVKASEEATRVLC